jgi:hypothetical protein
MTKTITLEDDDATEVQQLLLDVIYDDQGMAFAAGKYDSVRLFNALSKVEEAVANDR